MALRDDIVDETLDGAGRDQRPAAVDGLAITWPALLEVVDGGLPGLDVGELRGDAGHVQGRGGILKWYPPHPGVRGTSAFREHQGAALLRIEGAPLRGIVLAARSIAMRSRRQHALRGRMLTADGRSISIQVMQRWASSTG